METAVELVALADAAVSRGDVSSARALLVRAAEGSPLDPSIHLRLAAACRAAGDRVAALDSVSAALRIAPLDFGALLMRGHLLESLGLPEAGIAYGHALAQRPENVAATPFAAMTAHAERCYEAYRERADRLLAEAALAATATATDAERTRLDRFRTNALRRTKVWHSEPTDFHYPGLVEREFHDRESFAWLPQLEAATDAITCEFENAIAAERRELVPYVQYPDDQPLRQWKPLNNSSNWSAMHLLRNGKTVDANARHCPETMTLLASLPQPAIAGASPNAMFSLLAPGTRIPPHNGFANTRLVCHLPLIVPANCWFRVGAERREWKRGHAWVFDDTIEHEAANESEAPRVILIVDIWHPGLSATERDGVAAVIAAQATGHAADL